MEKKMERPFELLRRKSGEKYGESVIRNFYIARCYGLKLLRDITEKEPFAPGCGKSLHLVFEGTTDRMLSVARQMALSAHFVNFQEEGFDELPVNRTTFTFVTDDPDVKTRLSAEEYLCNLPGHCRFVNPDHSVENEDSYIDIEIHISPTEPSFKPNEIGHIISRADIDDYFDSVQDDDVDIFSIDTSKAYYASEMYNIGATIENIPYEDIHDTKRYAMALNVYQHGKLQSSPQPMFEKFKENGAQCRLKEQLSNVFCSDCFEIRAAAFTSRDNADKKTGFSLWEQHNKELSLSEHARWAAEKLIMGYRPLNAEERFHDQRLHLHFRHKAKLKEYRTSLKRNDDILAHIDLCSYRDLRRINPDNMKYDSFLMLGIPRILERVSK